MKAITILQPFATLIASGEKHFETRSWKTDYRGPLLIHAGKGTQYMSLCDDEPFYSVLEKYGYNKNNLPLGKIIAKVNLKNCSQITTPGILDIKVVLKNKCKTEITGNELEFGDYRSGRYAWKLEDVEILKDPIPIKGQQRLWNYDFKEDK